MAQQTQLQPGGYPGQPYGNFGGKAETIPEKGLGPFTALAVMAYPGVRHDFTTYPKTEKEVEEIENRPLITVHKLNNIDLPRR